MDEESVKGLDRFAGQEQRFRFFSSDLAFGDLRAALEVLSRNPVELSALFDDAEYRVALAQQLVRPDNPRIYALKPLVGLAYSHSFRMFGLLPAQDRFTADGSYEAWGLTPSTLAAVADELRDTLKEAFVGLPF